MRWWWNGRHRELKPRRPSRSVWVNGLSSGLRVPPAHQFSRDASADCSTRPSCVSRGTGRLAWLRTRSDASLLWVSGLSSGHRLPPRAPIFHRDTWLEWEGTGFEHRPRGDPSCGGSTPPVSARHRRRCTNRHLRDCTERCRNPVIGPGWKPVRRQTSGALGVQIPLSPLLCWFMEAWPNGKALRC